MNLKDYWQFNNGRVRSSLHSVSFDDSDNGHKQFMTEAIAEVINFDVVKRTYMNSVGLSEDYAKSVDALFQTSTSSEEEVAIYMVEFKNGDIKSRDIERKARDSVLIFQSITGTQLEDTRANVHFVLVYNSEKNRLNYRDKRALNLASMGRADFSLFGLAHLRGFCFKSVAAYDQREFEKRIVPFIED